MPVDRSRSLLLALALVVVCAPAASQTRPGAAAPSSALAPPAATRPPPRETGPTIDWKSAIGGLRQSGDRGRQAAAALDPAAVDRTRVPILLPDDPGLTGGARIYSFGDHYTISADAPGAGLSLTGTTATLALPSTSRLTMPSTGAEQLVVQRTVDGQLASFVRFGVLYTVEVRCDSPRDPRCRGEGFVRGLVARTTLVVLGRAARQAAGLGG